MHTINYYKKIPVVLFQCELLFFYLNVKRYHGGRRIASEFSFGRILSVSVLKMLLQRQESGVSVNFIEV